MGAHFSQFHLQSVVSAKSEPDTIVVKNEFWKSSNALSIAERHPGAKKLKIVMSGKRGKRRFGDWPIVKCLKSRRV